MAEKFISFLFIVILYFIEQGAATIDRPCHLQHYQCIAANLAANSKCNRGLRSAAKPEYFLPTFHFETPYFNSSYDEKDVFIRNLNKCKLTEFFINKETSRGVLSIDCPNLQLQADRTFIQHVSYREDTTFRYHITSTYPLIRITINFPRGSLDLCSASFYTDVAALPITNIVPIDKPTFNALSRDLRYTDIFERENFLTRGRVLASIFVQSVFCDYGCSLPI